MRAPIGADRRRRRSLRRLAASAGAALGLGLPAAPPAVAQDAAEDATAAEDTEPEPGLDAPEVIVVRGKREVTPTSTQVVPADAFELRPLESGGQLLEAVPGLLTAQHTGGGKAEQYFLRGFDADHGTDLAVHFDGVPVNLRSHAHGQGFLDLHFVTPEIVREVDAEKGPYLPAYGDFATAAAIELVPWDSLPESLVKAEAGEFDTQRYVTVLSPRVGGFAPGGPGQSLVSFEAYHTDGPFRNDEDLWRFSGFGRARYELTPDLALSGHLLGYHSDWHASGLIPERLVDDDSLSRFGSLDPSEGGRSTRAQGKLQLDWHPTERGHLLANAYLAFYRLDLFSNFTFFLNDDENGDGIVQRDRRLYGGGRIAYAQGLALDFPVTLTGGVETRVDDADVELGNQQERREGSPISDDEILEWSLEPYLELDATPLPWVRFLGGLRFAYFHYDVHDELGSASGTEHDAAWLPKANLVVSPFAPEGPLPVDLAAVRTLDLFANFGVGYHSNDARAVVAASAGDVTLPRATGAEVGLRSRPFAGAELAVSAFWLELESELTFVGDEGTTEPGPRSIRRGIEAAASLHPSDWLVLRGDIGYTDSRTPSTDRPIVQAPRLVAGGAVGIEHALLGGVFAAELSLRILGERYANEESYRDRLSGYEVLDLGARYRRGPVEVGLFVENLTDTEWRSSEFFFESQTAPAAAAQEDFHFTPGNPRSVRGRVTLRF